jgi:hypothetical protein
MYFPKLGILRLRSQWRSVTALICGVLLAAIIGATIPLYTNVVSQAGLIQRLDQQSPESVHLYVRTGLDAADLSDQWEALDSRIAEQAADVQQTIPDWMNALIRWAESSPLFIVRDGTDLPDTKARLAYYDALEANTTLIEGSFPTESETLPIPVVLSDTSAALIGAEVGDELTLDQRGAATSQPFAVYITGIVSELDASSPYWMSPAPFRVDPNINMLTTRANMQRAGLDYLAGTRTMLGWRLLFDHAALPFTDLSTAVNALDSLQPAVEEALRVYLGESSTGVTYTTSLPAVLNTYGGEVTTLGTPFGLLLAQTGALVLLFLLVIGSLVRRGERRELTVLQSRGALNRQIIFLRGIEAALICGLVVLVAPLIARHLLVWIMPLLTGIERLLLEVTAESYLFAALAVLFAFVVLIVTLIPILGHALIAAGGSAERSAARPWWERTYLDLIVLLIGFVALWQFSSVPAEAAGTNGPDPLRLLVPTLLFFALNSVVLRLFPMAMKILARFFGMQNDLTLALASWQVSREPRHYGRITFLLALALSIGWFAVSYQTTIRDSQFDQAGYRTGADVRLTYNTTVGGTVPPIEAVSTLENVQTVSRALRLEQINLAIGGAGLARGDLLAIEGDGFADVAYWRDDLGSFVVPQLETGNRQPGREIPTGTDTVSMEVKLESVTPEGIVTNTVLLLAAVNISLSLQLPDGTVEQIRLSPQLPEDLILPPDLFELFPDPPDNIVEIQERIQQIEWLTFIAMREGIPAGARLTGITVSASSARIPGFSPELVLYMRELTFADVATDLLSFTNIEAWTRVADIGVNFLPQMPFQVVEQAQSTDSYVVNWRSSNDSSQFLLLLDSIDIATTGDVDLPPEEILGLPAVVSTSFAEENELTVGQKFNLSIDQTRFWFEVIAITQYYPTLYAEDSAFLVTTLDPLLLIAQRRPNSTLKTNELWVKLTPDASTEDFVNSLGTEQNRQYIAAVGDRDTALQGLQTNLLTLGLIGLLVLSFVIGLLLSMISLVTYVVLSIQSRQVDFAVLRAMGFLSRRLVWSMVIEQCFVVITALILGLVIGIFLSAQILPSLSLGSSALVPPLRIQFETGALLSYVGIILTLFAAQLAFSALLINRVTTQALRAGDTA